jgi:hypothetical protein
LYTPELHDRRFPQLSTVPTAIRVVPIVSAEPTLSRLGVLANLTHRGSSSERFRFGADSESSAPCAIQMRCTPSRANPRYRSILGHDSTCRERQEVLEKTPKQSYRPQSDHDFLSGALFCGGSYSASLGCNVRCPCALSAPTFKRSPYESENQERHESSPSHTPPNIYKSEGPESRLPNCPHSGHVPIPRTMDNA